MLDFLTTLLSGLFGALGNLLPSSPFGDWSTITADLALGIGWLNWLVDVGGCLAIFVAWIAIGVAVTVAKIVFKSSRKSIGNFINWNGGYTE